MAENNLNIDVTFDQTSAIFAFKVETQGLKGPQGKSSYESAMDGGYTGTEAQFYADMATVSTKADRADVEAEQTARQTADDALSGRIDTVESMTQIKGTVDTYADLPNPSAYREGDSLIVEQDEAHEGKTSIYVVVDDGTKSWEYGGEFTVDLSEYLKTADLGSQELDLIDSAASYTFLMSGSIIAIFSRLVANIKSLLDRFDVSSGHSHNGANSKKISYGDLADKPTIPSTSLVLGETSTTAYRGDRGKTAYDHSQATGNPHGTTFAGLPDRPTVPKPPLYKNTAVPSGISASPLIFRKAPGELAPDGAACTIDNFLAFIEIPAAADRAAYYAAGGSITDGFASNGDYIVTANFATATTAVINFKVTVFYRKLM